ncbi:hypothetical protein [Halospeciosus flavus]|uniref:hypothetical protein n=1 Tax=Halospeciosus flavus TaxID=3032283 RepID=UPI00360A0C42
MAHNVVHTDDVPLTEFGGTMGESNVKLRDIGEVLAADTAAVKVWYIDSGESLPVSGNNDREEICYVLDGYFSLTAGPAEGATKSSSDPGRSCRRRTPTRTATGTSATSAASSSPSRRTRSRAGTTPRRSSDRRPRSESVSTLRYS